MLDFVVLRIESVIWCILNWFVDSYLYVKWTLTRFDVDKCVKTSPVPLQHPILIIAQTVHFMRDLCSCDISIRRDGWRNEQLIQQTEINDDFIFRSKPIFAYLIKHCRQYAWLLIIRWGTTPMCFLSLVAYT